MAAKNAKLAKLIADTADKPDGIGWYRMCPETMLQLRFRDRD